MNQTRGKMFACEPMDACIHGRRIEIQILLSGRTTIVFE
jgi:hypothetical protein